MAPSVGYRLVAGAPPSGCQAPADTGGPQDTAVPWPTGLNDTRTLKLGSADCCCRCVRHNAQAWSGHPTRQSSTFARSSWRVPEQAHRSRVHHRTHNGKNYVLAVAQSDVHMTSDQQVVIFRLAGLRGMLLSLNSYRWTRAPTKGAPAGHGQVMDAGHMDAGHNEQGRAAPTRPASPPAAIGT